MYESTPEAQCLGKRRFLLKREARDALNMLASSGGARSGPRLRAYLCPHCGAWHIGNDPGADAKARARAAAARARGWTDG